MNIDFRLYIFFIFASTVIPFSLQADVIASSEKPVFKFERNQGIDYPSWYEIIPHPDHKDLLAFQIEELYDEVDIFDLPWPYPDFVTRYKIGFVEKIGRDAFYESKLEHVGLSSTVRFISDGAFQNSMLKNIDFKPGLCFIGNYAFAGCKLSEVSLPESVIIIRSSAFRDIKSLQSISLPSTLECLGGFTFCGDITLKRIICYAPTPPVADDTDFGYFKQYQLSKESHSNGPNLEECVLYVPFESVELYRKAEGWCRFKNILDIESSGINDLSANDISNKCSIEKGAVVIRYEPGDKVEIYELGGILLDSRCFNASGIYRHEGSGFRIIRLNNFVHKVIL